MAQQTSKIADTSSFRDQVATVDRSGKRIWLFPQQPEGRLYRLRSLLSLLYLAVFFTLPFLRINGHPIFLINVLERKFILFGRIFWSQDFFLFGLAMIIFIVFIALFTVVFGRVFCGWACPQTIFMEMVFRRIEYWIEGNAQQQRLWKQAPWHAEKILRKTAKWVLFWIISFLIANTFLAYIIGTDELLRIITEPLSGHIGGFLAILIFTTVFFFVYSWLREQVCTVVCPYGRMQGVLLDRNSLVVAYDHVRGEPRARFKKTPVRDAGDCIDCNQCVRVCPTGIDIRNGTQLECVNCTACIDACHKMMTAVGFQPGLIRLASENNITAGQPFRITGRIKAYSGVMCLLLGLLTVLLISRTDVGISVLRTPGQLFQDHPDGRISNLYNYKFINKTYDSKQLTLRPENFSGTIQLVGQDRLQVPGEGYASGSLFVYLGRDQVHSRKTQLKIGVFEGGRKIRTITTTFLGPFDSR